MIIAITGTPGCGKTTAATLLAEQGQDVLDLNEFFRRNSLLYDYDEDLQSYDVDIDEAATLIMPFLEKESLLIMEGHLAHLLPCDSIIVLRCNPSILRSRLESRGYATEKVLENMEAEALDVILVEALETSRPTYEVDCSALSPLETANVVTNIINGEGHKYLPGNIDWSEELLKWC